jgi:hypothetical protein
MTPTEFDAKLAELRAIEQRMKNSDTKTPIAQIVSDRRRAQSIFGQLAAALSEFKTCQTNPDAGIEPDAR